MESGFALNGRELIFVTGATGFLGVQLVRELSGAPAERLSGAAHS